MTNKANAETLRAIYWTISRAWPALTPVDLRPWDIATQAPADWLARFGPDNFDPSHRRAGELLKAAGQLRRAAAWLHNYGVTLCNVPLTEEEDARLAEKAKAYEKRVHGAIATMFGEKASLLTIETGGDPRGHSVKIYRRKDSAELFTL